MDEKRTERRLAPRVALRVRLAVVDRLGVAIHGWVRDISVSGLFVETRERFAIGTTCAVSALASVDGTLVKVKATGTVVRHDDSGMGIHFVELCDDAKRAIQQRLNSTTSGLPGGV